MKAARFPAGGLLVRARPSTAPAPSMPSIALAVVGAARGKDLKGGVVAVLLAPEPAPAVVEHVRDLRPQDSANRRVSIGNVDARDLVVAVVLAESSVRGVEGRGGIAPFGEPPRGLVPRIRVVGGR